MKLTILIIGCGDIGVTLGQELLDEGHRVIGVRRQAKALEHTGIEPLALDLSTLEGADA
ncbi:MAG TPA: NAD(P)-dependent oxidoreductase, partial [Halomonas sp.]|nr:NAD(P)-dependent oxidoreductase [Halomonas sp.]